MVDDPDSAATASLDVEHSGTQMLLANARRGARRIGEFGARLVEVEAVDDLWGRLERFADDMRAQGLHVGLNGRCVCCNEDWPCQRLSRP